MQLTFAIADDKMREADRRAAWRSGFLAGMTAMLQIQEEWRLSRIDAHSALFEHWNTTLWDWWYRAERGVFDGQSVPQPIDVTMRALDVPLPAAADDDKMGRCDAVKHKYTAEARAASQEKRKATMAARKLLRAAEQAAASVDTAA